MRAACQSLIFKCRRLCNQLLGEPYNYAYCQSYGQSDYSSQEDLRIQYFTSFLPKNGKMGASLTVSPSYLGVTVTPLIFRNHEWASLLWGIVKSTVKAVVDDALAWRPLSIRWNVSPALFLTTRWSIILSLWKVIIPWPLTTV